MRLEGKLINEVKIPKSNGFNHLTIVKEDLHLLISSWRVHNQYFISLFNRTGRKNTFTCYSLQKSKYLLLKGNALPSNCSTAVASNWLKWCTDFNDLSKLASVPQNILIKTTKLSTNLFSPFRRDLFRLGEATFLLRWPEVHFRIWVSVSGRRSTFASRPRTWRRRRTTR